MRVLLMINPKSRRGDRSGHQVRAAFRSADVEIFEEPINPGRGAWDALLRYRDRVDCAAIGGGDGTLISAIPRIIESGLPLGILPLGTFNDLARTLEVPTDPEQAVAVILEGHLKALDVGRVNGKFFVNEASIGISTHIARRQTSEVKKRFGFLGVIGTTLATVRHSRPFRVDVAYNGTTEHFRTIQLTIANSHHFGGFITNKEASIDDGYLDLYSLELSNWSQAVPLIKPIVRHELSDSKAVRARKATRFEVRTTRPRHIFTDGEPATMTPATFEVVPKAIRVFVPRSDASPA
ncbi:MAG: lipid kinase [Vulcanimicrobiaceae bacterium]